MTSKDIDQQTFSIFNFSPTNALIFYFRFQGFNLWRTLIGEHKALCAPLGGWKRKRQKGFTTETTAIITTILTT
jgi:hypothetical protein